MVRCGLTALGLLLIAAGTLWALQGAGLVMWPAQSFMLAQRNWVIYGLMTVVAGAVVVALARRRQ